MLLFLFALDGSVLNFVEKEDSSKVNSSFTGSGIAVASTKKLPYVSAAKQGIVFPANRLQANKNNVNFFFIMFLHNYAAICFCFFLDLCIILALVR